MRWLLVVLFAWGGAAWGGSKPTLALYPIEAEGLATKEVQQLEKVVQAELAGLGYLEIIPPTAKSSHPCKHGRPACLAAYGKSVRADEVLYYSLEKLGKGFTLAVLLVDSSERNEVRQFTENVGKDLEDLTRVARGKVLQLKAKEKYVGQVVFNVSSEGKLWIDSKEVKDLDPLILPVGSYKIERKIKGKQGSKKIDVKYNRTVVVEFKGDLPTPTVMYTNWERSLAPKPLPINVEEEKKATSNEQESKSIVLPPPPPLEEGDNPIPLPEIVKLVDDEKEKPAGTSTASSFTYPRWPGYAGLAVGGALLIGGVVQEIRAGSIRDDAREIAKDGANVPYGRLDEFRNKVDDFESARNSGYVFLGLGAGLAAGSGAYLYFVVPSSSGVQAGVSGQF